MRNGRGTFAAASYVMFTIGVLAIGCILPRLGPNSSNVRGSSISGLKRPVPRADDVPQEITALVRRAAEIMRRHSPEDFAEIASPEARLTDGWVLTANTKWVVEAMAVPHDSASPPFYLAVFHTWHTCESDGDHVYRIETTPGGWKIGAEIPEGDTAGFRIRDHDLAVATDVPHKTVDITDRVDFERTGEPDPGYAMMRLSEDYTVDKIALLGLTTAAGPIPFKQAGGVIAFLPPSRNNFTLKMHYSGAVDHPDGDFLHAEEVTLSSYWYPVMARLPATATVTSTAPPGFTVVAQGELVSSEQVPGGSQTTFRNSVPVSYFSLDIGRYSITSRKVGSHTLSVYLLDASSSLAKQCLDVTEKALAYYESHFGSFPYTRYGIVQTHGLSSMALEAYSFATFGPHTLPDLIPHELSHTWWGGRVPCTYLHSMWNEAFADYSDDLYHRSLGRQVQPRAAEIAAERHKIAHAYDSMPLDRACDTNDGTQSTIGYDKGHRVLRLLEYELGQDVILKCMSAFLKDHRSGDAAEWPEFEASVNRVTKTDYRWFFSEWLERAGLPNIRFENVQFQDVPGGKQILADIVQSGIPYQLTMDCKVTQRTNGAVFSRQTIDGPRTRLQMSMDSSPASITLDPAGIVPLAPPPGGDQDSDYTVYRFGQ